jgi:hypothetical protein
MAGDGFGPGDGDGCELDEFIAEVPKGHRAGSGGKAIICAGPSDFVEGLSHLAEFFGQYCELVRVRDVDVGTVEGEDAGFDQGVLAKALF